MTVIRGGRRGAGGNNGDGGDADSGDQLARAVDRMNRDHALVMVGDGPAVLQEMQDADGQDGFRMLSLRGFKEWHRPTRLTVRGTTKSVADWWLGDSRRRRYEGITFAPRRDVPGWYNLWRGFSVEPDPAPRPSDRCARLLDHIAENLCDGDERLFAWVVGWFAQMVQDPGAKLGTSLVLRGGQGTGKTIVGQAVGSLLGGHYRLVSGAQRVTGRFNAYLANCLLLQLDEATWGGDHAAAGVLKDLVTGRDLLIEYKGKEPVRVRNHLRLLFTGNNAWVVPAGLDERRFAVLDVATHRQQDAAYFGAIQHEMETGGRAALLAYLLTLDLSTIPLRQVPSTGALLEQQIASLPSPAQWWLDVLHTGALPGDTAGVGAAPAEALYTHYVEHGRRTGTARRAIETELGNYLTRHVPGLRRERRLVELATGLRRRFLVFPPLADCRRAFAEVLGTHAHLLTWGDDTPQWSPSAE